VKLSTLQHLGKNNYRSIGFKTRSKIAKYRQRDEESKSKSRRIKIKIKFSFQINEPREYSDQKKPLRPPPLPFIKKKTPSPLSPIRPLVMSLIPKLGGTHPIYGVFLGGGSVGAGWDMDTARYRFSSQRRDEKSVGKVERGLTDARAKTTTLKFNGTLELDGTEGIERKLDKDQFVRTIEQLTREHGQQVFYAIEKSGTIHDLLRSPHLFTVEDVIDSNMMRLDTNSMDASKYDSFERDDIDMTRLAVEYRLTEKIRDVICTRYDHDPAFYDYTGPVLFMMALDICNASQSFDIDGAQKKLDELKLETYPGEDITACAAYAQKQFKTVQSGYAPPVRSGSKLLLKCSSTECEQFNRQVYAMLDLVKKFENKYKLAYPKLITTHQDYSKYGPIALIAWLQREHTDVLKDHEWPSLASKLPQSNYVSKNNGGPDRVETQTCYKCNKVGHIATYCPDKTEKTSHVSHTKKPEPGGASREEKVLA
jgi:hypothetical protein